MTQGRGEGHRCNRCRRGDHDGSSPKCPARRAKCRFCGKEGHFEAVCFKKSNTRKKTGSNGAVYSVTSGSHAKLRVELEQDVREQMVAILNIKFDTITCVY